MKIYIVKIAVHALGGGLLKSVQDVDGLVVVGMVKLELFLKPLDLAVRASESNNSAT